MSATTPTIRAGCRPTEMLRPTGSLPGDCVFASFSLTITTGSAPSTSAAVNARPLRIGDLSVAKYSGLAGWNCARRTSAGAVDSPTNVNRRVPPDPLNGVRLLALIPTDSTPGNAPTRCSTSLMYALRCASVAYGFFDGSFGTG